MKRWIRNYLQVDFRGYKSKSSILFGKVFNSLQKKSPTTTFYSMELRSHVNTIITNTEVLGVTFDLLLAFKRHDKTVKGQLKARNNALKTIVAGYYPQGDGKNDYQLHCAQIKVPSSSSDWCRRLNRYEPD